MPHAAISVRRDGTLAWITVGDGRRRNALARQAWSVLRDVVDQLGQDRALRAVVLRGHGDTDFCAGSDLTAWLGCTSDEVADTFTAMEQAFRSIETLPVPVVAMVTGVSAGAGCQLALACDLRIASESSRIGMPTGRLGILPSASFAARLSAAAGAAATRDLLYTGRLVSGADAARLGLADRCVPDSMLEQAAVHAAAAITSAARSVTTATKLAVATARSVPGGRGGDTTVDFPVFQSALAAFLERRLPLATP